MDNCRYCGQPIEAADLSTTYSYWGGFQFACHRKCKDAGIKSEAYDCQVIDADCNDCKHFKRGSIVPHKPEVQAAIDSGQCPNFSTEIWNGHCLKFDRPTRAFPKKWSGLGCFEHRRG